MHRAGFPFLALIVFAIAFAAVAKLFPADVRALSGEKIVVTVARFSFAAGAAFGLLSMIAMYILYGIGAVTRLAKSRVFMPLILIICYAPWAAFGYQLVYREPRYTTVAKILIDLAGVPTLYAGTLMLGAGVVWLMLSIIMRKKQP